MPTTSPELQYLRLLTKSVRRFLAQLDVLMCQPSTEERGRNIARLCNDLDLVNDSARHFGLNIDLKTGKEVKREND